VTAVDESNLVLVWAPRGRDGKLATELLVRTGLQAIECTSVDAPRPAAPSSPPRR
jgi:hypothetical protein